MQCHKAVGKYCSWCYQLLEINLKNEISVFPFAWRCLRVCKLLQRCNYCGCDFAVAECCLCIFFPSYLFFLPLPFSASCGMAIRCCAGVGRYFEGGWVVRFTWQNSHECRRRMKKIKKFCFSELEDSLHDFPTDGIMCFQAEILLTIQMEIEGTGGADSHINLICPWMQFSVCPDPAWLKTLPVRPECQTQRPKWKASTFQ